MIADDPILVALSLWGICERLIGTYRPAPGCFVMGPEGRFVALLDQPQRFMVLRPL